MSFETEFFPWGAETHIVVLSLCGRLRLKRFHLFMMHILRLERSSSIGLV